MFSFWFQREKYFNKWFGAVFIFPGQIKKYAQILHLLFCASLSLKGFVCYKRVGFFPLYSCLNVGNVKYSCSICRVNNRSQLSVCAGNVPQTLCFYVCWYFFERAVCGSSHIFIVSCFRIKCKAKKCLDFGNQILTVRAKEGNGAKQMSS